MRTFDFGDEDEMETLLVHQQGLTKEKENGLEITMSGHQSQMLGRFLGKLQSYWRSQDPI